MIDIPDISPDERKTLELALKRKRGFTAQNGRRITFGELLARIKTLLQQKPPSPKSRRRSMTRNEALNEAFLARRLRAHDEGGLDAFLHSLAASGYAVAPVEATCEMLEAGRDAIRKARSSGIGGQTIDNSIKMECYREAACWRAMLAAAAQDDSRE